jgi:arylsulfatase A-like enzyme
VRSAGTQILTAHRRIAHEGISYNRFHTTAMCSPTRAALLTGRNHQRVGAGQIAELANDWDGYSGVQPKTSAMVAEVLKDYGYSTGAWGKWHNTPAEQTTAAGPFDYWPSGYGFEYFYGFLAGEASQYEPNLVRNTAIVHPPKTSGGHNYYHLSEDLAENWPNSRSGSRMRNQQQISESEEQKGR